MGILGTMTSKQQRFREGERARRDALNPARELGEDCGALHLLYTGTRVAFDLSQAPLDSTYRMLPFLECSTLSIFLSSNSDAVADPSRLLLGGRR
ncbi:hypothetical protein MUK42_19265 [Musa troglodytarum]|uniref:Uncharacterized protein n=1 Tax=Musa troglodytarum TaxID=320322 RepID=A0A9E7JIQ9_9LILI|nr:hypothetical protein MUK42_19265 [Musa troglodytarum]